MRTIDFRGKAVGSGCWVHGDLVWMGRQPAILSMQTLRMAALQYKKRHSA